jgi:hypothetical protein
VPSERAPLPPVPAPEAHEFHFSRPSRRRLWHLHSSLHCSILGTCFSPGELRQLLRRIDGVPVEGGSEHELHTRAVSLAGRQGAAAKLLHKALDRKFDGEIERFQTAEDADGVLRLWRAAFEAGDIPGAYWAALTHPATTEEALREIAGEVHMLSHLVGASSRADIRHLRQLKEENAALAMRLERQDRDLRRAIARRDRAIQELKRLLDVALKRSRLTGNAEARSVREDRAECNRPSKREVAAKLLRRDRLSEARTMLAAEKKRREHAEGLVERLQRELQAFETSVAAAAGRSETPGVAGITVLYAGGRQNQVIHLKRLAKERGAEFLHHDGGVEEASALLPALVAQADAVFFPVDCISHGAMTLLKATCRQMEKPYVPLRSSGLSSFAAALSSWTATACRSHSQSAAV